MNAGPSGREIGSREINAYGVVVGKDGAAGYARGRGTAPHAQGPFAGFTLKMGMVKECIHIMG